MTCNCTQYIDCGEPPIEAGIGSEHEDYQHICSDTSTVTNMPFDFTFKMNRTFSTSFGWDKRVHVSHQVKCGNERVTCDNSMTAVANCTQSENCVVEANVLYYIDRMNEVYVWKNVKETLNWTVSSGGKTATFRMKWGNGLFHKICIPTSVKTNGVETFFLSKKGVTTTLATATYQYNPFPDNSGGSTWGLYGNSEQRATTPDTKDVACILLFPLVPKQASPEDNDVLYYGFYDYNAIAGGFTQSDLAQKDGGKDYFYPYWCRCMPESPVWREAADTRYEVIQSSGKLNLTGDSVWNPPDPIVYPFPFGSFCSLEDGFVSSAILQFGANANNSGIVYNYSSFGDLFKALKDKGVVLGKHTKFDPIELV